MYFCADPEDIYTVTNTDSTIRVINTDSGTIQLGPTPQIVIQQGQPAYYTPSVHDDRPITITRWKWYPDQIAAGGWVNHVSLDTTPVTVNRIDTRWHADATSAYRVAVENYSLYKDGRLQPDPRAQKRQRIKARSRFEPVRAKSGGVARAYIQAPDFSYATSAEITALQLLRNLVPREEFRRYLKHGHVHVRGPSGLAYKVGRMARIQVHAPGIECPVAQLCMHLAIPGAPPSDEVAAKIIMIECDEPEIWLRSNITACAGAEEATTRYPQIPRLAEAVERERSMPTISVRTHAILQALQHVAA